MFLPKRLKDLAQACYIQSQQYKDWGYLDTLNQTILNNLLDPELQRELNVVVAEGDRFCLGKFQYQNHDVAITRHPYPGLYSIACRWREAPTHVLPAYSAPLRADEVQGTLLCICQNLDRPLQVEALLDRTLTDRPF